MDYAVGHLTREYVDNYGTELWVNRTVSYGSKADTVEALVAATGQPKFATIWESSGRRGIEDIADDLQIRWWESYSLEEGWPGEVLCLVVDRRVRVVVAMVVYGPDNATIINLFCMA